MVAFHPSKGELITKGLPRNEHKRTYIADFGRASRQFIDRLNYIETVKNSLYKDLSTKAKFLDELTQERVAKCVTAFKSVAASIAKAEKEITNCLRKLKSIHSYQKKVWNFPDFV